MTCGIYLLEFEGTDRVYIGQSVDIEKRYQTHLSKARRGIHAEKLQKAFNTYGVPNLHILKVCDESLLDYEEECLIDEFNSVIDGFNTAKKPGGGHGLFGQDINAKYTNDKIIEAFLLLVDNPKLTSLEIAEIAEVSKYTVDSLSSIPRKWLEDLFPEQYSILKNRSTILRFGKNKTLADRNNNYPCLISPCGSVYTVENCSQFSKEHGLNNAHVIQVLKGKEKQHKGWRVYNG